MINPDELRTQEGAVTTADANFGSAIPQNMKRCIYRVKVQNEYDGANLLTLGKRENGAGATTTVDVFQSALQYDIFTDPEQLQENSEPLYEVGGKGDTGDSYVRAVTDNGNAYLTIWYVDKPAE
jgi:hypothetical protein